MRVVLLDHGSIAWFEPESETDLQLLEKAKKESWTEEMVLSAINSSRKA